MSDGSTECSGKEIFCQSAKRRCWHGMRFLGGKLPVRDGARWMMAVMEDLGETVREMESGGAAP